MVNDGRLRMTTAPRQEVVGETLGPSELLNLGREKRCYLFLKHQATDTGLEPRGSVSFGLFSSRQ